MDMEMLSYYRSKVTFFEKGYACIEQLPTCKPVFKRYRQMNAHGEYAPYIGCLPEESIAIKIILRVQGD
ncbi:hypothetical protein EYZ11_008947 [Aspergillus tanneri]|uniref:Uncharacterized protein n=1 Tax=Aspergillus tanneri TaxID=1220188 RepID=A0A4S3J947_9EURO|nr:hypothetical protein EYZ11_008947 [Aspergillus tanneri]